MVVKTKKAAQSEATRDALIAAARKLFATQGFAATGTEDIVAAAGVTRGALYHQFKDKRELFEAVFRKLEDELIAGFAEKMGTIADPLEQLRTGTQLFLDACMEPEIRQISLVDAPSVLGWQAWRDIETEYGLGLIRLSLEAGVAAGVIVPQPIDTVSHILLGALNEAALLLAAAEDHDKARAEITESLDRLLGSLTVR